MRLCIRVARELHIPITAALELPGRELALWAAVFEAEASGTEAETETEEPEDVDPRMVFRMLGGEVTNGNR